MHTLMVELAKVQCFSLRKGVEFLSNGVDRATIRAVIIVTMDKKLQNCNRLIFFICLNMNTFFKRKEGAKGRAPLE